MEEDLQGEIKMKWQNIIKRRKTQRLEEQSYITDRISQGKKQVSEDKDKVKFVGDYIRELEELESQIKQRDIKRYGKEFLRRQKEARQRIKNMPNESKPVVDLKGD